MNTRSRVTYSAIAISAVYLGVSGGSQGSGLTVEIVERVQAPSGSERSIKVLLTNANDKSIRIQSVQPLCDCIARIDGMPSIISPWSSHHAAITMKHRPASGSGWIELRVAGETHPLLFAIAY